MVEVKLMRNGVYVEEDEEVISIVRDNLFLGGRLGSTGIGTEWCSLHKDLLYEVSSFRWTEDTLVLPEEYLT